MKTKLILVLALTLALTGCAPEKPDAFEAVAYVKSLYPRCSLYVERSTFGTYTVTLRTTKGQVRRIVLAFGKERHVERYTPLFFSDDVIIPVGEDLALTDATVVTK